MLSTTTRAIVIIAALLSGACSDETSKPTTSVTAATGSADFLIYNGYGIDPTSTEAIAGILRSQGTTYRIITDAELSSMKVADYSNYRTFIWPGGDNSQIETALTPEARTNLRKAVIANGLNYVGICAGAFVAIGPKVALDDIPAYGLALVEGEHLPNYVPPSGEIETMVDVVFPDRSRRQLMLWSGPYFETTEGVIARYEADEKPAIIQLRLNKSFIVLSGPHPEAPRLWQTERGLVDTDGLDWDIAWKLINAAHTQQPLPEWPSERPSNN